MFHTNLLICHIKLLKLNSGICFPILANNRNKRTNKTKKHAQTDTTGTSVEGFATTTSKHYFTVGISLENILLFSYCIVAVCGEPWERTRKNFYVLITIKSFAAKLFFWWSWLYNQMDSSTHTGIQWPVHIITINYLLLIHLCLVCWLASCWPIQLMSLKLTKKMTSQEQNNNTNKNRNSTKLKNDCITNAFWKIE